MQTTTKPQRDEERDGVVQTTFRLTRPEWERAKIQAIRQGKSLTEFVATAVREYLERNAA
jgi:predicted HicB family RNase H-like nuclease